jgi:hypothetical protein
VQTDPVVVAVDKKSKSSMLLSKPSSTARLQLQEPKTRNLSSASESQHHIPASNAAKPKVKKQPSK